MNDAEKTETLPDADHVEESKASESAVTATCEVTTESIVESILMATDSPVSPARISQIVGDVTIGEVRQAIASLNERYEAAQAAFRIEEIAKGYQILTLPEFNTWLRKLLKVRTDTKVSPAAMETLAVVAYRQPVMRVTIEEIRGVGVGEVLQRLREMNLVKIVGRAEELGRPLLYGTTKRFLEVFGLGSLQELPSVEELKPPKKQESKREVEPTGSTVEQDSDGQITSDAIDETSRDDAGDDGSASESAFARIAQAAKDSDKSQNLND